MVTITVNVSKEKALEHKYFHYPMYKIKKIIKTGTPMQKRVARRILRWNEAGKKLFHVQIKK